MFEIKKVFSTSIITAVAGLAAVQAYAATYSGAVYWNTPPYPQAATCSATIPDEKPLAIARTLVVGNDVPDGTEVFSWGYGEWSSDVTLSCVSTGAAGSSTAISGFSPETRFTVYTSVDTKGGIPFNNPGLRLKVWIKNKNSSTPCTGSGCVTTDNNYSVYGTGNLFLFAGAGEEIPMSKYGGGNYVSQIIAAPFAANHYRYYPTFTGQYSIRASLVKVGTVSYGPLTIQGNYPVIQYPGGSSNSLFQGSGITIAPPSCRLRTTDYTISMGRWAADTLSHKGAPAYGTPVPVNLSLECSGKTEHVRFRFEDTGTSLSTNKNISLYDWAGGNKIDGLEIEMLYNGTKVNVDNTTITDTGSHGSFVSFDSIFGSASTAAFQARYVQNGPVRRHGSNYTGPVTGKVNIYVTYD